MELLPSQPKRPSQPASFANLARRISGWTSNLLATGIIVVLALVVGKQLVVWWRVEPDEMAGSMRPAAIPVPDLAAGGLMELGFGQVPYQIQCRHVQGDGQAAADALVTACRDLAADSEAVFPDFGPAEAGLLKLAARLTPISRGPGQIEVFASREGMPLAVAMSGAIDQGGPESSASEREVTPQLGAGQRRVVTWGLAASAAEGEWNLYVAHALRTSRRTPGSPGEDPLAGASTRDASTPATRDASSGITVPIPPGSQRSLALSDARGGGLTAFVGSGQAENWVAFYSAWFSRQGTWIASQPWQPLGGCWHARYERAENGGRTTVDVQFGPDGQIGPDAATGLVGLISIAGAEPPAGK